MLIPIYTEGDDPLQDVYFWISHDFSQPHKQQPCLFNLVECIPPSIVRHCLSKHRNVGLADTIDIARIAPVFLVDRALNNYVSRIILSISAQELSNFSEMAFRIFRSARSAAQKSVAEVDPENLRIDLQSLQNNAVNYFGKEFDRQTILSFGYPEYISPMS